MTKYNKHIINCHLRRKKTQRRVRNVWYNEHKLHAKNIITEKYLRIMMENKCQSLCYHIEKYQNRYIECLFINFFLYCITNCYIFFLKYFHHV